MSRTALYRHFDAEGCLLYVGISDCLSERDKQHAATAHWHESVEKTETEWCICRDHALALERVAITYERPLHNIKHNFPEPTDDASMSKSAVIEITDTLGTDRIQAHMDVSHHAVRHARTVGMFPASWYAGLRMMCAEAGLDCPEAAFNFKSPSEPAPSPESAA